MLMFSRSYAARVKLRGLCATLSWSRVGLFGAIVQVMAVSAFSDAAAASPANPPTFSKDVAPILYDHCAVCHRPGGIASDSPMLHYEAVHSRAAAIGKQVATRLMPPWPADSAHSLPLRDDPHLTDTEIAVVVRWVQAGAPRGNAADLPPPPPAPIAWQHPAGLKPDAVLALPEVTLAASGEVPYVLKRIKVPLLHDRWISAMEVRPGNAALVHHMGITEIALPAGVTSEQLDNFGRMAQQMGIADVAADAIRPAVPDPINPQAYDMLGVYTPGTTFEMFGDDSAKLLKGGENLYINFNVHYTTVGKVASDRSQLALWFSTTPPKHQLFRAPSAVSTLIAEGRELLTDDPGTKAEGTDFAIPPVPAQAADYQLVGLTAYVEPVTLYQLQPHAHMRARDFRYSVIYPDGREVTVLSVPKYDFHWQLAYQLATPLALPAGAKLVVTAHYDNSSRNPHLRNLGNSVLGRNCGPEKLAYFRRQNQSWHEMFSPLVQYSIDPVGKTVPLPLIEAVGCMVRVGDGWNLTRAAPQHTSTQSTSAAALRNAANRSLGEMTYGLVGASMFGPASRVGRKVALKGVLLEDSAGPRINVTSLQAVGKGCS